MKLLLFSDLHANASAARRLVEKARTADVVVGAGDFGNLRRDLRVCMEILRSIDRPSILVAGNNETTDELIDACRDWPAAQVLHGASAAVDGISFFGLPGGVPVTPFGSWSFDFTEDQAAAMLADGPIGCVLVSHSPPIGAVDVSSSGRALGSVAVREAVLRLRPKLVVCGHIHASAGRTTMIGETPVVNAGPDGVEWTVDASRAPISSRADLLG